MIYPATPFIPPGRIETGFTGDITDVLTGNPDRPREDHRLHWTSSYQGQTDYQCSISRHRRLEFRWGKRPWRWSYEKPEDPPHWNYPDAETFHRQANGDWGILHGYCSEPVEPAVLTLFRELCHDYAVTGYYDHEKDGWVICEPTTEDLSRASYNRRCSAAVH